MPASVRSLRGLLPLLLPVTLAVLLACLGWAAEARGQPDQLESMAQAVLDGDIGFDLQRLRAAEPQRPAPLSLPVLPDDSLLSLGEFLPPPPPARQFGSGAPATSLLQQQQSLAQQQQQQQHQQQHHQQAGAAAVALQSPQPPHSFAQLPNDGNSARRTLQRLREETLQSSVQLARSLLQEENDAPRDGKASAVPVDPSLAPGADLPDPAEFSPADQLPEPEAAARFSPKISSGPGEGASGAASPDDTLGMVVPQLPSDGSQDELRLPDQEFLPVDNANDGEYSSENEPNTATDGAERLADKLSRVGLAIANQYRNARKEQEWVAEVGKTMEACRQKADEVAASFERRKETVRQLLAQKRRLEAAQKELELTMMLDAQQERLKSTADELRVVQDQMNQFSATKAEIQSTIQGIQKQLEKLGVTVANPSGSPPPADEGGDAADLEAQDRRGASLMQQQMSPAPRRHNTFQRPVPASSDSASSPSRLRKVRRPH